ncbi:hypothetical protein KsCSTR_11810 [Candidatus Kuenenia stuttgartiensis]|jgi:hypothetical protein|uniref:Uncharacterized protein n=1 Tax=Kuenenia stuttgartiensis TaxID=174633 RepID=Q1PYC4_KUEST|nr:MULTISPECIES: hypothetical protein [Kuenenia]MBE7547613.1 hypothetical protein [Planctomycetia bacterium]MBW7942547.1 hypothetical protein [Candidatus Kuenenia stuttgartiensis]MCF6152925.1 hypothetical protein [Candidatus Kuenenia stuttgartiensis]MCL4727544.1 hypothetical protein [Candidatus Kuenenia stuttgartiensis]MCZ7624356.1 hypothetical protein [Candidatus Kuenenia sp.]
MVKIKKNACDTDWLDEREREEYKDLMVKDDKELDTLIREATSTGRPLSQGKKAGVNEIWEVVIYFPVTCSASIYHCSEKACGAV